MCGSKCQCMYSRPCVRRRAQMPSATVAWTATLKFNGRSMSVSVDDIQEVCDKRCMVIAPYRAPIIALLTGLKQTEVAEAAAAMGIKVSIAGHPLFKELVKARNNAQVNFVRGKATVSQAGIQRLFGGGGGDVAEQPTAHLPRRKRKQGVGDPADEPPSNTVVVNVGGFQIECVGPTKSRDSLIIPLDDVNVNAFLSYLHIGIKTVDDIRSGTLYEYMGLYRGRYVRKATRSASTVDHVAEAGDSLSSVGQEADTPSKDGGASTMDDTEVDATNKDVDPPNTEAAHDGGSPTTACTGAGAL